MAKKKAKRAEKAGREQAGRWTVRGVPVALQRAAMEAARARGLTLGQWLARLLEEGIARDAPSGAPATRWAETIEARLARLEAQLGGSGSADADTAAGAAPSGSARGDG